MSEAYRRFPRIASNHTVLVTKLDGELEQFALTRTIAVGGCGFLSNERVGQGAIVELLIALDRQNVIKVHGKVVYERALDDGAVEVGVEFIDITDDDAALIERLFDMRERARFAQPPVM